MIRKILYTAFFCAFLAIAHGQPQQYIGATNNQVTARGTVKGDSGVVLGSLTDTSSANRGVLRTQNGTLFYNSTDNFIYYKRNGGWAAIATSSAFYIDSITVNGTTICQWKQGTPTCYAVSSDNNGVFVGVDSVTATTTSICQWKSGVPTCYAVVGNGIDSVTIKNDLFCQWANGDSVCYDIDGDVLAVGVDSVVVAGNNICQWIGGLQTCYSINNGGQFIDSIWVTDDGLSYVYGLRNGTILGSFSTLQKTLQPEPMSGITLRQSNDTVYIGNSATNFETGLFQATAVLNDSTVTLTDTTIWKRSGVVYEDFSEPDFPITRTSPGYIRQDAIYINPSNVISYTQGIQDTSFAAAPSLASGSIMIVSIFVSGDTIAVGQIGITDSTGWRLGGNVITSQSPVFGATNSRSVTFVASGQPLFVADSNLYTRYVRPLIMDKKFVSANESESNQIILNGSGTAGVAQSATISLDGGGNLASGNLDLLSTGGIALKTGSGTGLLYQNLSQNWLAPTTGDYNTFITNQNTAYNFGHNSRSARVLERKYINSPTGNNVNTLIRYAFNRGTVMGDSLVDADSVRSAVLALKSTSKGFKPPTLTGVQMGAVSSPVAGLMLYNSDSASLCVYNGTEWVKVGGGGGAQDLQSVLENGDTTNKTISINYHDGFLPIVGVKLEADKLNYEGKITLQGGAGAVGSTTYYTTRIGANGSGDIYFPDTPAGGGSGLPSGYPVFVTQVNGINADNSGNVTISGSSQWADNGSDIYNNNAGSVGIGTSSPTSILDVNGDTRFRGNGTPDIDKVPTGIDTDGNWEWKPQIASGVSSFNTRSGAVTPQTGDYSSISETLTNKTISGASNTITNVSLTTGVTGILPAANGGTGINNSTRTLTINTNSGTLAFAGASTTMTFPSTTATIARTDAAQTFTGFNTFSSGVQFGGGGVIQTTQNAGNNFSMTWGSTGATGASMLRNVADAVTALDIKQGNASSTGLITSFSNNAGVVASVSQGGTIKQTGVIAAYAAKTTTYTIVATDYVIDCTSGTFTVTLPTAVGATGQVYVIKNSGAGTITVATTSSQTIDGTTTKTLSTQYASYTVQSNGSNWIIL